MHNQARLRRIAFLNRLRKSRDAACAMLRQEAGHTLDETVVAALLGVIELDDR